MHARRTPVEHRFSFPFYFYAVDLSELPELDRTVRGFGYNHWKPVSLQDKDYLSGPGGFREKLTAYIDTAAVEKIILITMARFVHKVFNPVSFYYCLDAQDQPVCMAAEVNNTFKERHLYVMEADGTYPVTCTHRKQFHVSPFNNMDGRYDFSFSAPGETLNIGIRLVRGDAVVMDAALWGKGRELTTANLWKTVLAHPFTAGLTLPRILRQAAVLHYRKKLPVFSKPEPSNPNTIKKQPACVHG